MAHRSFTTDRFMPDPFAIMSEELAGIIEANERNANKIIQGFWQQRRGFPGSPIKGQDEVRNWYYETAARMPGAILTLMEYGSIRSGKTEGILYVFHELMLKYPGTRALGVRRTVTELWDSLIPSIIDQLERHQVDYRLKRDRDAPEIHFPNGSCWILRSSEKSDKQKENKADTLGGAPYALALLEEANEIKDGYYNTVIGRMSHPGLPARLVAILLNPSDDQHWTYKTFLAPEARPPVQHRNVHFFIEDNAVNLGWEYINGVKERYKDSPTLYRKFYLGLFGPTIKGEPIFAEEFRRTAEAGKISHVSGTPIEWNPNLITWRCWDFGFRRPAVVIFQDDPVLGQIRVLRAEMGKRELIAAFASRMKNLHQQLFPDARWEEVADVAGNKPTPMSPMTELQALEAVLGRTVRTKYTLVEYGLNVIGEQLTTVCRNGQPAILIDQGGANLIADAFEFGYTQDPDYNKDDILKPYKDMFYEHVMDAFRYGVVQIRTLTTKRVKRNPTREHYREVDKKGYQDGDRWKPPSRGRFAGYNFGRRS